MKRNLVATATLAAIGLALFVTIPLPAQATQCSLANVAGSYGYTTSGFVATGAFVPVAAAGKISFDRHGNVSGTQTRVVAGSSLDETYSGTYSVNPDCTGSFTVLVEPDTRTSTVDLVWTDNTNGVSAVFTNPGFILTATARRIHPQEETD